ncbi:MAG: hypothetical protein EBR82_63120 [Caulobacteraceae bacterium]|nr:hypothetical protein [Caulobacteraceae bacterium]
MKYSPLHQAYKAILDTERRLTREGIDSKWLDSLHDALCCVNEEISRPMPMAPEWQTLTEDEIHQAFCHAEYETPHNWKTSPEAWCKAFAAYIEAKLKEKNHG